MGRIRKNPRTTKYVTVERDEHGDPFIVFVFTYVERDIIKANRQLEHEAEPVLDKLIFDCGPPRLIADCEHFHKVPAVLDILRAAHASGLQSLNHKKDDDEHEEGKDQMIIWEEKTDPYMEEMWVRLATRYLATCDRIELGVWVGDAGCVTFLSQLPTAIDRITDPQWSASKNWSIRPKFVVTFESPDDANSDDAHTAADDLEEKFEALKGLTPAEMKSRWGVPTFGGLFEWVKEQEVEAQEMETQKMAEQAGDDSDDSQDESSHEDSDDEMDEED